jgi:branched-chain amino acid aminotransferase
MNGRIVEWESATLHVWDEAALRGASAFEGIRAFWLDATHQLLALDEHLDRLRVSAALVDIPHTTSHEELETALSTLLAEFPKQHVYLRPTVYAAAGRSSLSPGAKGGVYIGAFANEPSDSISGGTGAISKLRRSNTLIPPAAKTGGTYLDFRLVERERIRAGVNHMLLLNEQGEVAEADGAAIILVDRDQLLLPSIDTGILDSITRRILISIARQRGVPTVERRVLPGEVHGKQVMLAGTLTGVVLVEMTDCVPPHPDCVAAARALAEDYRALCQGRGPLAARYLGPAGRKTRAI